MEAYEALTTRRSIRRFESKKIPKSILEEILKAAQMAPSAHNRQSWAFIVVEDLAILQKIPSYHPHAEPCREATLAIVVLGDYSREPLEGFCVQNCAAATLSILLAAHSKNLGSVWMGIYPKQDLMDSFKKNFSIPDTHFAFSCIALGFPKEQKGYEDRYDPKKVHINRF